MPVNSPTKSTQVLTQELDNLNKEISQGEAEINKELGLYPPKGLSPSLAKIWDNFFQLIRKMYDWDLFYKEHIKKFLFDFFEVGKKINGRKTTETEEIQIKKLKLDELWINVNAKVSDKKLMLEMLYLDNMNEFIDDYYENLATEEERIEFLEMIYEGNLPPEIQELVDDYEFSKLSPEEIDEIQRMALAEATSKYQGKGGLNLGKTGTVITAGEIAEFIDSNGDGANDLEEPAITRKPRTLPNLPNGNFSQNQSQNSNQPQQNQFQNQPNNQPNRQQGTNNIANSTQNQQPVNNQMPNNQNSQPANNIAPFANNKFEKLRNLPK